MSLASLDCQVLLAIELEWNGGGGLNNAIQYNVCKCIHDIVLSCMHAYVQSYNTLKYAKLIHSHVLQVECV